MSKIPTELDVPQANIGALRTPAPRVSPEAFGAGIGEGIEGAADVVTDFLKDKIDEAETDEAKDLDNKLADNFRTRMNGDGSEENPGYYSFKGNDAIDAFETVQIANEDNIKELADSASSDRVRRKFESAAAARREAEMDRMAGHITTERVNAANTTSAARQDSAIQDAVTYYNDPNVVGSSIEIARNEAKGDAARNGLGPEATETYINNAESQVHVSVLSRMMSRGEDNLAQVYFADNQSKITDIRARAVLEEQLIETTKIEESQRLASDIMAAAGGDVRKARELARDQLTGATEDAVVLRLNRLSAEASEDDLNTAQTWVDTALDAGTPETARKLARERFSGKQETLVIAEINARAAEGTESEVEKARKIADEFGDEIGDDYQKQRDLARSIYSEEGNLLTRVLSEIKLRETEQNNIKKKEREDAYKQAIEITSAPGQSWSDVPVDVRTKLSATQQRTLQNETIPSNPDLNDKFFNMLTDFNTGKSDEFLTYDFTQNVGEMPESERKTWLNMQSQVNSDDPREKFRQSQVTSGFTASKRLINSIFAPRLKVKSKSLKELAQQQKSATEEHMLNFVSTWHDDNPGKRLTQEVLNTEVYNMTVTGTVAEDEFFGLFGDQRSDADVLKVTTIGTAAETSFRPDLEDEDNVNAISKATGVPTALIPEVVEIIQAQGMPVTLKNIRAAKAFMGGQ